VNCWGMMGPAISDYNMRLILLSVIQLSVGHCSYLIKVGLGWSEDARSSFALFNSCCQDCAKVGLVYRNSFTKHSFFNENLRIDFSTKTRIELHRISFLIKSRWKRGKHFNYFFCIRHDTKTPLLFFNKKSTIFCTILYRWFKSCIQAIFPK